MFHGMWFVRYRDLLRKFDVVEVEGAVKRKTEFSYNNYFTSIKKCHTHFVHDLIQLEK